MASSGLDEYFMSAFEDKLLVRMPEKEADHLTPATRLLEKKREMTEVEQALQATKDDFHVKMESLQQRREELERKEQDLKDSLLKFDKFLKENDMKRSRAIKKTKDEEDLALQKEREISRLQNEIDQLEEQVDQQAHKIQRYKVYREYMEQVLEYSQEFDEIREIIARYDTLKTTRQDLLEREHRNQDAIEAEKADLMKFTEEKNNEILSYNNQLAQLQTRLEKAQSTAVKWESEWTRIQTTAAKKTLMLGQIKMATHNLYTLINKHLQRKVPIQEADQTLLQLDKIQMFIKDLTEITHDIQRRESAAVPNMQLLAV
ncbi:coiled-coil domain-containing protein 42 homolog [Dysidea avara]|uniref:coiled-coil domain-containing protein 42 homolog n=1 Tax=Dysidea avara TaxID=196820 RepID=UPI00331730A8